MSNNLVKEYIADLGIDMSEEELRAFTEFSRAYFRELVNVGYLLRDVPFNDMARTGKYKVLGSALELWKTVNNRPKLV